MSWPAPMQMPVLCPDVHPLPSPPWVTGKLRFTASDRHLLSSMGEGIKKCGMFFFAFLFIYPLPITPGFRGIARCRRRGVNYLMCGVRELPPRPQPRNSL
jgi:hypothetical protein